MLYIYFLVLRIKIFYFNLIAKTIHLKLKLNFIVKLFVGNMKT